MPEAKTQSPDRHRSSRSMANKDAWTHYSDQELLDTRICDLKLKLEETPLVEMRDQLYAELDAQGIRIKPRCWLSDDWFSPDGIPGIAIPFYLAHPRLMRLERKMMLEVEGGTREWCMRILRHEAGHAVDTAFRLHRRKSYKEIFGNYHDPYPDSYKPKPRSKKFVLHLEPWYAQSHPSEDFAETFAVWLTPRSKWRKDYAGWGALKKVEYVDGLMQKIAGAAPKNRTRRMVDPVSQIRKTLREHYDERHQYYRLDQPSAFDEDLKRLFPQTPESRRCKSAAAFLRKNRAEFSRIVAQWTGEYRYNINQVLREMIERCTVLNLEVRGDEAELKQNLLIMLTVNTMNYLHGAHRVAL